MIWDKFYKYSGIEQEFGEFFNEKTRKKYPWSRLLVSGRIRPKKLIFDDARTQILASVEFRLKDVFQRVFLSWLIWSL